MDRFPRSDAELDQYLEANGRFINMEDLGNLPEYVIRRLRVLAGSSDTARLVDIDDLKTRLEAIPPPSPATAPPTEDWDEEEYYRYNLERQMESYNTLVTEGGRPSHPVSLGRNILENPGEYSEILSYWQRRNNDWEVFTPQLRAWRHFRKWQRRNREEGRFPKYVEGVKDDLVEHGFTRSFQLDNDPERQDKLTTWIEYLSYEYWWYDKRMRFVKRHQPRSDEAWKKLVDSKVLKLSEMEDFICNNNSSIQYADEEDRAERAMESARSARARKAVPILAGDHRRETRQQLEAALDQQDAAIKSLNLIKRRNRLTTEFLKKTKNYRIAKEDAEHRSILLRWVLEQVPLIELELNGAEVAENDSNGRNDEKGVSKRNGADNSSEDRVSKRQRQDSESTLISDRRIHALNATERESQLKHSSHNSIDEGRASKPLERNDQTHFPPHETSDAADPTPIEDPLPIQAPTTQDSGPLEQGV